MVQDTVAVVVDTVKAVVDSTVVSTSNSLIYMCGGIFFAVVAVVIIYMKFRDKGGKIEFPK